MNLEPEIFDHSVSQQFDFLKKTDSLVDLHARGITLADDQGLLVPVCELHADDEELIELFARWRDTSQFAFPTRFPVTVEGTRAWLRKRLLDVDERLLFLVLDRHGHPVGHLGLLASKDAPGELEIDNVVRGVATAQPGIMTSAMRALLDWAEETFGPNRIFLRVLDDNTHAVDFYLKLGFVDHSRIALARKTIGEHVNFDPLPRGSTAEPDAHFLMMDYAPRRESVGSSMILTAGPSVSARECSYVLDAARNGWNQQWSGYLTRFEEAFAARCHVRYAMATSSCTGAMHLALLALGIGPGDEVIVPEITWVATASAVCHVGATPVFADVDPQTVCLDPDSFERLITSKTKAVMPVHLYGHPARMDRILDIACRHGLYIVEDAAPSMGAQFMGRPTGSFGDFGCFSFQGAKLLVTGEGGMLLTDNEQLFQRARKLGDHGRSPGTFWIDQLGYKYKMSNLQAAFGLGQLERIDSLVQAKRRVFAWYQAGLASSPHVTLLAEGPEARSAYWMTNILVNDTSPLDRDQLRDELRKHNIDTRPVFPAISQYPFWPEKHAPAPHAQRIGERGINLPSGVCLKRDEVDYVCRTIRQLLDQTPSPEREHDYTGIGSKHPA